MGFHIGLLLVSIHATVVKPYTLSRSNKQPTKSPIMSTSASHCDTIQSVSETIKGFVDRLRAQENEDRDLLDYLNAAHDNATRLRVARNADTGLPKLRKDLQKRLQCGRELRTEGASILSKAHTETGPGVRRSRRQRVQPTGAVSEDLKTEISQWRDKAQAHLTVPEPGSQIDYSRLDNEDTERDLGGSNLLFLLMLGFIKSLRKAEFHRIKNCKAMGNRIRRLAVEYRTRVLAPSVCLLSL
jgi:hypothetical protein